jgi:succinate dehydrogenase/fumarate reductase-like Fe-S protein
VNVDPKDVTTITPLPHMYVVQDLVVDMSRFYQQYKKSAALHEYFTKKIQNLGTIEIQFMLISCPSNAFVAGL